MRIIIVGAGAVGSYLAQRLSAEGQDVIVIEDDESRAGLLQDSIDALVMVGNGAAQGTLEQAGAENADLLIAVTSNDGANILSCYTATQLGTTTTIARIEDPGLKEGADRLGVDFIIDPSAAAADEIAFIVGQGGASEIIPFADGRLTMVGGRVAPGAPLTLAPLSELRIRNAEWDWAVAAIVRNGRTIVAHGDTRLMEGDHALIMTKTETVEQAAAFLGLVKRSVGRAIIVGSTRLADLAADRLHNAGLGIVLIDEDPARCHQLALNHPYALVLTGDPTDPEVLGEIDLGPRDVLMALTGWDEVNVLSCLIGKARGAGMAMARFHRVEYVSLLAGVGIDAAISSRLTAASAILRFVRRGHVERVATFSDTDAEAIELEVEEGAEAVGRSLLDLKLPTGVVIGGISRNETNFVPDGSSVIRAGDHIIIFSLPADIEAAAALFSAP